MDSPMAYESVHRSFCTIPSVEPEFRVRLYAAKNPHTRTGIWIFGLVGIMDTDVAVRSFLQSEALQCNRISKYVTPRNCDVPWCYLLNKLEFGVL